MLSKNTFRFLLIGAAALVNIYLWGHAICCLAINFPLKEQVDARITQWQVEELSPDQYGLRARYGFEWEGISYQGQTLFSEPQYLNQDAAIYAVQNHVKGKQSWRAWIDPTKPSRSSLEKKFPTGFLLRAVISLIVLLYFILMNNKNSFIIDKIIKKQ